MNGSLATALGCAALAVVAGCGADRPSVDDIATSFKSGKAGDAFKISGLLTDAQYACIGSAIVDSGLSDEAVRALEDADEGYQFSDEEKKDLATVGTAIQACRNS